MESNQDKKERKKEAEERIKTKNSKIKKNNKEIEDLDTKDSERFFEVVDKLQKEFYELTGATLNLGYHNQELNGDRYDSVDGWFFHVTGVRELNEAGKQVDEEFELLQNRGYVVFG